MRRSGRIGIGIIGTGFMGRAHALAYRAVGGIFPLPVTVELAVVADPMPDRAEEAATVLGIARWTDDWQALVADPDVDIVSVTTPNRFHGEMARAAIAAGKHVHCEKPLAPSAEEALALTDAAERAGIRTQVGFNYLKNPMVALAREIIAGSGIGEVVSFRGVHAEDFMADPQTPWTWRLDPAGGGGAIADLGSHIIALARHLVGPVTEVCGTLTTSIPERPEAAGSPVMRRVEVDDIAQALIRFAGGATGTIEANWVAQGRDMQLAFEIIGSRGALAFTQERLNELLLFEAAGPSGRRGFRRIEAGPEHPPYGHFCVAPGHQLGFNDLKTIEVHDFLQAILAGAASGPDFREGYEVQHVVDAIKRSARERRWVELESR